MLRGKTVGFADSSSCIYSFGNGSRIGSPGRNTKGACEAQLHSDQASVAFRRYALGEIFWGEWRDVDLEQGIIRVTQSVYEGHFDEPKSRRSRRSVPLGAKSIEILTARKPAAANPEALVFSTDMGTPFDRHNLVNRQLKPTCKKLGLTGVGWHWLRHAHAALLDAVGTPLGTVQALLGHSSSEITREVYLHSIPANAQAAVRKVEDLLIGPKLTQVVEDWETGSSLIQ